MKKHSVIIFVLILAVVVSTGVGLWKGIDSFLFAWVLNLMLMMMLANVTKRLRPRFTSPYYISRKWERHGDIYKWLGVKQFQKLLIVVGWEKLNKRAIPVSRDRVLLQYLEYNTRLSEFGHLVVFFIVLGFASFVAWRYTFIHAIWLISLNVLLNLYPLMLQRYNRPRIERVVEKIIAVHHAKQGIFAK